MKKKNDHQCCHQHDHDHEPEHDHCCCHDDPDHHCQCEHEEGEHHCHCHEEEGSCQCEEEKKEPTKEELYNLYLMALADLKNSAAIWEKEKALMRKYYFQATVEKMLPILDAYEMAFKTEPPSAETKNYLVGFKYIYQMLKDLLAAEGVQEINPAVGTPFDPHLHYAGEKEEVEEESQAGIITAVFMKGYQIHDRVIRSSNVKVTVRKQPQGGK